MSFRYIVVDDAAFIREVIKSCMASMKALCAGEASSGKDALQIATANQPDLIFLDVVMPEMSGIEITSELRLKCPGVKIIACTTLEKDFLKARGVHKNFDYIVEKPFTKQDLQIAVKKLLNITEDLSK